MQRAVVVLPQPLSPTRPSVSPSAIEKLTSSTARTWPTTLRSMPFLIGKYFLQVADLEDRRLVREGGVGRHPQSSSTALW